MAAEVYIGGKRVRYDNTNSKGKGGEAEIFDLGDGRVLKLFKTPSHVDLALDKQAQQAAQARLDEHQNKLQMLMQLAPRLPRTVVTPEAIATTHTGTVVGYAMTFLTNSEVLWSFAQRDYRKTVAVDTPIAVLRNLGTTVVGVHTAGVVIGDFNDLNILVRGTEAHLIDSDSFQFGPYKGRTYTTTFVDPLLCDPNGTEPVLQMPHNTASDWYAYNIMAFQLLLFVGPYGGVYQPKDPNKRVPHPQRPLRRITVFDPEVKYPRPAIHFGMLPDDLLQHFHRVFEKDERVPFPAGLLSLHAEKCAACGQEHFRAKCPSCFQAAPSSVKETTMVRGKVTATLIFRTGGIILRAEMSPGVPHPLWLWSEGGRLMRENKSVVGTMTPDPQMRFRLRPFSTFIGKGEAVFELATGRAPERKDVDATGSFSVFDVNAQHVIWAHGGVLYRDKNIGPERIGDVLRNQTFLWVGQTFGFGFYRVGSLHVAFVFKTNVGALTDAVKLPSMTGQLLDATCVFAEERVWLFTTTQEGAHTMNHCTVLHSNGDVEATTSVERGSASWLGNIRGAAAAGKFLFMPTDDGVAQIRLEKGTILETERFPDTAPFVDSATKLLIGADCLFAVSANTITRLVINRKA